MSPSTRWRPDDPDGTRWVPEDARTCGSFSIARLNRGRIALLFWPPGGGADDRAAAAIVLSENQARLLSNWLPAVVKPRSEAGAFTMAIATSPTAAR